MKKCELCQQPARTYCESDEAILCWACDSKVHGANFLVARHSRTLLCHACHAPTAWKASGEKLVHAFSVCCRCVAATNDDESRNDDTDDDEGRDSDDDVNDVDYDEEGENQVVPFAASTPPPPPSTASSSSSEDSRYRRRFVDNASDLRTQDDLRRLAARLRCETDCTADTDGGGGEDSVDCARPLKHRRLDLNRSIPRDSWNIESTGKS